MHCRHDNVSTLHPYPETLAGFICNRWTRHLSCPAHLPRTFGTKVTMQTIASSSLTARPVAGIRSAAPRTASLRHSNGVRQQQHLQQQQRAAIVSMVSLAEVKEIEDMDFQQESAAGSSADLPSGNVKVGRLGGLRLCSCVIT